MTNQKQSSKRQSVVIAILAVLLVGLLAFNITYAFFTDKETNSDQFTFGTISLKTTGDNVVDVYRQTTKVTGDVMPGDVMTGAFKLGLNADSEDAFARFKLTASPEYGYIFEEGTKAWVVEDGASVAAGAVIAYINGELVQAAIDESQAVTIYEDGVATPVTGAEADAILDYNTYVEYIVAPGQTQKVTFALNEDDPDNLFVEATVTITEEGEQDVVKTLSANAEEVTEILINDAQNFARTADIEAAVAELNDAIQKGTNGVIAGLESTDFVAPGDGWVYKIAEMTAGTDEVVDLTYTLPITLGNALQDVTINLDLVAQVVQAANVEDADATGATGWDSISTEHQAVNSIKMFYAALEAHGDILENNVAND